MRELTIKELQEVNGGLLPLLALGYSIVTGTAVRSAAGYVASRAATIYATYTAAESMAE